MNERREINSRNTSWAQAIANVLAKTQITPNQISILSIVMSLLAFIAFYYSFNYPILLLVAVFFIQMRLLCNLFDGMVAVEYKKKSRLGDIFNDLPDRFADLFILLGFSYSVQNMPFAVQLGWLCVVFSMMTAYIRVLGRSLGTKTYFSGPMAKQHRMFVCSLCAVVQYVVYLINGHFPIIYCGLYVIALGSIITCFNRLDKISSEIKLTQSRWSREVA
ncbi:CDP-alcohol phosphatidyltransferase family protein [Legionella sp. km535]|uniref:CDP-alcohol phosphatidyltransferase family protein n=1 Tax=Legionella sp. km535 TaxID=2498107 RepID=UPI000F8E7601|nr:CDP-alcohol phosphatidyltransferase family protein [Legionella sp. km535]RUR19019.1 CDP-alcohol phosphatidyltransferase family protein [Legionella sp. km535]